MAREDAIGIVGSGAVAQALGRVMSERGAPVVALAARDAVRAARAAAFVGPAVRIVGYRELLALASRLIVAVSDDGLTQVAEALARAGARGGIVVHTCGSRGPDVLAALQTAGAACGVLHPLQTLPTPELGAARLPGATFGTAGDPAAMAWAERIARLLGGQALQIRADGFGAYHAAAALAGNALAALIDSATVLLQQAGVEPRAARGAIAPLCRTSLDNILDAGPEAALTGPVARGDAGTIRVHLSAMTDAPPDVVRLYCAASRRLVDIARRRGLPDAAARQVMALLDAGEGER